MKPGSCGSFVGSGESGTGILLAEQYEESDKLLCEARELFRRFLPDRVLYDRDLYKRARSVGTT